MSDKIKNGDKPIAPVYYADGRIPPENDGYYNSGFLLSGLTKREYFAALAMQGMWANSDLHVPIEQMSIFSVQQADSLLAELERTKNKQDE